MKPVSQTFISHCFGFGEKPIELHRHKLKDVATKFKSEGSSIEANLWLPFAAEAYHLSRDIKDYILVPVPVMFTALPNTNGDSVSLSQFLKFNPTLGMQAFKTFRGKPCHLEHDNKDITRAKGVILDVFLRPIKRFGNGRFYKLVELMAYDRSKDPALANAILSREHNAYSVGFYYNAYSCSICNNRYSLADKFSTTCVHTAPREPTHKDALGRLVYRRCEDIVGFETSVVGNPAYVTAIGPHVFDPTTL